MYKRKTRPMMAPITYAAANDLLNVLFSKFPSVPYSQVYVALSTSTPSKDGTGVTEPSAASYERMVLGSTSVPAWQKMGTPVQGSVSNNNSSHEHGGKIYFPTVQTGEDWGTITHICLYSAKTGGTLIAYAALDNSITLNVGYHLQIPVNGLTLSLT